MYDPRGLAAAAALACLTAPAVAQTVDQPVVLDPAAPAAIGAPQRVVVFSAVLGIQANPAYFGSEDMIVGPSFRAGLARLRFAGVDFGSERERIDPYERRQGFGYGLSFRYVGQRNSGDYSQIDGLDDIDPTLEIGGGIGYAWTNWEVIAEARYGFGGSDAWVGELKANYVMRPMERLAVRIGPRAFFGSENYMDTYFGIDSDESVASGLAAYDPDPGLVSLGVEAVATYQLTENWWLEGGAKWSRFQNDAADSPVVESGDDDYSEFRIGFRRTFSVRF